MAESPPNKQCEAEVWREGQQMQCHREGWLTRLDGSLHPRRVCGMHMRSKEILYHRSYVPPIRHSCKPQSRSRPICVFCGEKIREQAHDGDQAASQTVR